MTPYEIEADKGYQLLNNADAYIRQVWLEHVVFSWQWWIQVVLTILPWVLWFIFRKKESSSRLMFAGLFVMIISYSLDIIGIKWGLWAYYYELLPYTPSNAPWNFSLIPVAVMFAIQLNPLKINRYIKAVIFSALASFVVEPIFVRIGFYETRNWSHFYSFPITALIYIAADWLSRRNSFEKI